MNKMTPRSVSVIVVFSHQPSIFMLYPATRVVLSRLDVIVFAWFFLENSSYGWCGLGKLLRLMEERNPKQPPGMFKAK